MAIEGKKLIEMIKLPGTTIAAANGAAVALQQFWNWLCPTQPVSKRWVFAFMAISALAVAGGFIVEHLIKSPKTPGPEEKTDKDKKAEAQVTLQTCPPRRPNFEDRIQEARKQAERVRKETRES